MAARRRRKSTNEWEFQGQVLEWLNTEIRRRPGLDLDRATQEKPDDSVRGGKRNDLVVWRNRLAEAALLTFELKTPATPITDPALLSDATAKAQRWQSPFFAIWNMQAMELYSTPPVGGFVTPADALRVWPALANVASVEDWLEPSALESLKAQAIEVLDAAWEADAASGSPAIRIESQVFVTRLTSSLHRIRSEIYTSLAAKAGSDRKLRKQLRSIAAAQGFLGFVDDVEHAIAGQYGYRLIGQILFYFALRRNQPALKELLPDPSLPIPASLRPFWDDVRRYDYEALFRPDPIDELIPVPLAAQEVIRSLIDQLHGYDWSSLREDVLGSVFEHLIPPDEQMLLGQFYTPRAVADLLVAFAVDGQRPLVLDPGCGSGTFLMSAYELAAQSPRRTHSDILSTVWGFDISPFATELASINLFRQDLSEFDNFPRVVCGSFFDRFVGEKLEFPPARSGGQTKVEVPVPHFDAIVGNPPYLRSQNQDDLDSRYKARLFDAAARAGVKAASKTDLFAFFIYQSLPMMNPGSRIGFVTSASWLTTEFGAVLQALLLGKLRLVAIVGSAVESFFSQVDVNTVLLIAELPGDDDWVSTGSLRFATLKKPLHELISHVDEYWRVVTSLTDRIEGAAQSFEDDSLRVKVVPAAAEKAALSANPNKPRNWSRYLRAPLSYYQLLGDAV